ncbi:MAG: ABC transporter permease [Lachnospiraceae bacterium]
MKKLLTYPLLIFRRMLKSWPAVLIMTLLLAFAVGLVAWQQLGVQMSEDNQDKLRVGLVGKFGGSYMGFDYASVIHMDTSSFTFDFVEVSEEEARAAVENGSLLAYVKVPQGFITALSNGENLPVQLVIGGTQGGLGSQLIEEISKMLSDFISETEKGIFTTMDVYAAHGLSDKMYEIGDYLSIEYLTNALRREELYSVTTLSEETGDLFGYYISAGIVVLVLFFGMNGASLLLKSDMAMTRLLKLRGLPVALQCLGEYLSYALLHLLVLASILGVGLLGAAAFDAIAPPAEGPGIFATVLTYLTPGLFLGLAAAVLCLSALHFLLFSGVSRLLEGLLLSFLVFAALAYVSGLFYPLSFFPKGIRVLATFLPTNAAREEVASALEGTLRFSESLPRMLCMAFWGLAFFVGGVFLRIRRCKVDD